MSLLEILLIAVGLAMDAFAVSLAAGASGHARNARSRFRLAFHFGLFQFLMPVMGWFLGVAILYLIESVDHWIAMLLLCVVGVRMILSGFSSEEERRDIDPSRGWTLVVLCIATSIDALAVGLSLAVLGLNIWYPSLVIGVVTGLLSLIATLVGNGLSAKLGKRMEIVGGLVLIAIGLRILISHLGA